MRKIFSISSLSLTIIIILCSCSKPTELPIETTEPPIETTEANNTANTESVAEETNKELTSVELARLMGYGINLGNTMEACNSKDRVPMQNPSVYEQMWGQPITTPEMITGMKNAGFSTLRIPVAWTNAIDFENGDYTIGEAYLDRVDEIINYALDEDMYVIVNDHWDYGWMSMFSHSDKAVRDKAMEMYVSMWTQISERYSKYDDRLIFEAANEELGDRLNDKTAFNPEGGKLTQNECYELLTVITQKFVDTVRLTGGNNAGRFLLIPGYNTDIKMTCDDRYKMPKDTVADKLLLSVHYYTPWSYCGDTSGVGNWGTTGDVNEQNELLAMMTKFTEQGYGIVLGEWGVLDNEGDDRYTFFFNFLNNCDKYGYCPVLWDTNNLYSKEQRTIISEDIAKLHLDRSKEARSALTVEEILIAAEDNLAWTLRKSADRQEVVITADEAFAWIMFSSGDWSTQYSVGDAYKPESITEGAVATDVEITGAGTYTLSIDFTGTEAGYANGISFSAVGIINGEILFPGYIMELKEVLINGEAAVLSGNPYTTSDNKVCTRVNLYNEWVSDIPNEARITGGDLTDASPVILENYAGEHIKTLSVTFEYLGE